MLLMVVTNIVQFNQPQLHLQCSQVKGTNLERSHIENSLLRFTLHKTHKTISGREGETETDRQTNRDRDIQTDRQTDRERQTDRQAGRQADRQTQRQRKCTVLACPFRLVLDNIYPSHQPPGYVYGYDGKSGYHLPPLMPSTSSLWLFPLPQFHAHLLSPGRDGRGPFGTQSELTKLNQKKEGGESIYFQNDWTKT